MKKKLTAFLLALMMLTQVLVPGSAWAMKESQSYPDADSNLVQVGITGAENYPKLTNKVILDIQKEATLNSRKNMQDKTGVVPFNTPYLPGQDIPDKDKPKIVGNVTADFKTKGLDNGDFDWEGVFGKDSNGKPGKAKLVFKQWLKNQETGISYQLEVNKDGKYSWNDWEGKPARIPLYSQGLEAYTYSVYLDQDVSDKVKLLTYRIAGNPSSPGFHKDPETGLNMADIIIDLTIQQVASTKFVSEWHTDLAEASRPPVNGEFDNKIDQYPGYFPFSKQNGGSIIIRNDLVHNSDYQDPGYSEYSSSSLTKTPEVKVTEGREFADENDEEGTPTYEFDEANKIIITLDKKHKFKYDFKYDVIDGGKLTMTEILPVTFDANGGKFASITEPNAEQKIVKEVDYEGTLTDKAEDPTKERETFKGWSTTKDGTPLTEEEFNKAIKNVKEAKTFYAIWDNNPITADELTVHESFKDGTGYVNDFIPTLDQLKGQVKIKDANGDPQALTDDDTLQILDDSGNAIADAAALKTYLYDKLKEDPSTEVSRNVTLKAKVNHKNGTSQTVDINIKVIKNIYEAKTEEGKPNYVPEDYVKVTVDPTTKAEKPQKYFYYVNPAAKVVIPGKDPVGTGDNKFVKWTYDDNGTETEYKLANKPRHQFKSETTITAQYVSDVIPQEGDTKPDYVPDNFIKVKFVPTDKATDETKAEKIFWVNPEKEVTIPVKDPVGKQYYTFTGWKMGVNADGEDYTPSTPKKFTDVNGTTITATYTESKNIIPVDPTKPTAKPEGYVTVTFDADLGLKLTGTKYYYVKANSGITIGRLKKPEYKEASGYEFVTWDKADTTKIEDKDIVVTALAKFTPSKPDDRPDRPYPEIIYRDKIVEKEKIVEKIIKVGENDELLKEIRYMQGYNGKFRPYDGLTRAEAAQILANALKADGYRYDANYALSYSDVGSKWYTDAVRVVTQANVFQGYSDGTFRPQGKITRAEWVATLRRFQDLKKASGNTMMLRSGHWATEEVEAAYQAGWLGVYQDGTAHFDADKPITRQEVAYVSNRAFRRVLDKIYLKRSVNTLLTYKDINPSMPLYEDILCASNTLLTDGRYYKANTIVMDNVTFNIVTDYLRISQKKFQYNVIR